MQTIVIIEIYGCDIMDNICMEQLYLSAKVTKYICLGTNIFKWTLTTNSGSLLFRILNFLQKRTNNILKMKLTVVLSVLLSDL